MNPASAVFHCLWSLRFEPKHGLHLKMVNRSGNCGILLLGGP